MEKEEIAQLFSYLTSELSRSGLTIEDFDKKGFNFSQKHRFRKIIGNIEDLEKENTLEISIYSTLPFLPNRLGNWMSKQFLGLRNSIWTFILFLATTLTLLIIFGRNNPQFLKILGISLICIGGVAIFVYFIVRRFFISRRHGLKEFAETISLQIIHIIEKYTQEQPSSKVCWNCFLEIQKKLKTCPNCKVKI